MELYDINRFALIVTPSEALLKWAISEEPTLSEEVDPDDTDDLATVYLLPDFGDMEEAEDWVEQNADAVLETLLEEWIPDTELWPEKLDLEQLEKYADFTLSNMVIDTVDAAYDEEE
ncbi:hypothetical protein [Neolewinella antarctica]|uniref:Uncharacterized protein n=1 Tax=Neolewinella antarctica TaxID=442734 RepID=A0ABX0X9H9_9BACT|nr:hypothetical protein [Neolewinella antarctica]NJC25915.1 hypothetical protein [Neolewinella antarctica]